MWPCGQQWCYDESSGVIDFWENLSFWTVCCFPRDKYDTDGSIPSAPLPGRSYPFWNYPYGFSASRTQDSAESSVAKAETEQPKSKKTKDERVVLRADMSRGLAAYAMDAKARARRVAARGVANGVLTFVEPVGASSLDEIRRTGIEIDQIEIVTTPDADGLRWTFFGGDEPAVWQQARADASSAGVDILGVVSANVTVSGRATLDAAQAHPMVYVIDLSKEEYERTHPHDRAIQNDLYWTLAGWD